MDLAPDLPPVSIDPEQFKRVVVNLIDNAAEAMQDSPTKMLTIQTRPALADTVEIVFADTGCGITAEQKEKLFLPYFSTKGRGTGLGLAIVSHILTEHNANIRVEDNKPCGAWFTVEIPCRRTVRRRRRCCSTADVAACRCDCKRACTPHMRAPRILIVDDEPGIRQSLSGVLEDEGFQVEAVENGEPVSICWRARIFDLVILDIWLPGIDGLETLSRIQHIPQADRPVVVMISGHGTIETAVKATKLGAYDFLEKPLSIDRVLLVAKHALEHRRLRLENEQFREAANGQPHIVGDSVPMKALRQQLALMAGTNGRVLIYGESGTGKELVAHALHAMSPRAPKPFVEVNCAAIPEDLIESELFGHMKGSFTPAHERKIGKFQKADGGTMFLDEVGDMSLRTQSKVLRVLEDQRFEPVGAQESVQVDVRVVAATNKNLEEEIERGNFREDCSTG